MRALVVPTCRPDSLREFLAAWKPFQFWDLLIVCASADIPMSAFEGIEADVYRPQEINVDLGDDAWIISQRDSARRSYGFLRAAMAGAETIYTLDDDCFPHPKHGVRFGERHLDALLKSRKWAEAIPGLRTRGLPYRNRSLMSHVMLNVGLWSNIPDLGAAEQLVHDPTPGDFEPPAGSRILPARQYTPISGMNLAFWRPFLPLAYFGLQGEPWPFARFDDIWFGIIAKRICDHLGWSIAIGEPHVEHKRASNPIANLVKEAPGVALNEVLWQIVDAIELRCGTAAGCMDEIAAGLKTAGTEHAAYLWSLAAAMQTWTRLVRKRCPDLA